MNILVAEDNPSHLKLAHLVLSAAGHKVSNAEAAEQVLEAINQDKPHVILLDLNLPDMDGLTLVRTLKADPRTRDIHIVAVTSYPDRFKKSEALAAGCDAYLLKPIDTRALSQQVEAVAVQSSARNEPETLR
jgi:two-component system cell cycle response regulator